MSKHFRPWKIDESQLLPPSVQDYVPKEHLSRLIVALVREELDLSAMSGSYRSGLGQPPFDPRMMTALLPHDQRVPPAAFEGFSRAFRAGVEACGEGGIGEARPCRAGRHQDQGQCVQAQGDELRSDEEAGSGA